MAVIAPITQKDGLHGQVIQPISITHNSQRSHLGITALCGKSGYRPPSGPGFYDSNIQHPPPNLHPNHRKAICAKACIPSTTEHALRRLLNMHSVDYWTCTPSTTEHALRRLLYVHYVDYCTYIPSTTEHAFRQLLYVHYVDYWTCITSTPSDVSSLISHAVAWQPLKAQELEMVWTLTETPFTIQNDYRNQTDSVCTSFCVYKTLMTRYLDL